MMKTIRQQLLLGLLGTALICILASAYFLYQSLLHEVNELADLQLRQLALALPDEFLPGTGSRAPEDPEEEYTLQAWDQAGQPLRLSVSQQLMPRYVLDGFLTVSLRGQEWRIYGKTRNARYVQVAQAVAVRDLLAVRMALRAGAPLLVLAFVLAVMILVVVEHALKPLERLAQTMAGKSADALVPVVEEDMPPDLRPVVKAINGLMYRFDNALIAQRAFIADAAHELRSPLTAMTLQLQLVERAIGDRAKAIALSKLSERLNRTTHLVRQLLSLARHEGSAHQIRMQKVDLGSLLQNAVADHSAFAESREIDLGVDSSGAVVVQADPDGLQVLLNNLVDNALRYTHKGGRVDLQSTYEQGHPVLRVSDNGPGVEEQYRGRLFDRFFRPDGQQAWGSGLGLSIVRSIADRHNAEIKLGATEVGCGLTVTVLFPNATLEGELNRGNVE